MRLLITPNIPLPIVIGGRGTSGASNIRTMMDAEPQPGTYYVAIISKKMLDNFGVLWYVVYAKEWNSVHCSTGLYQSGFCTVEWTISTK